MARFTRNLYHWTIEFVHDSVPYAITITAIAVVAFISWWLFWQGMNVP